MFMTQEMTDMKGTIIVKVPQLLEQRRESAADLMYGARLAQGTAYRLAKGKADGISFDVLAALCTYFGVNISDILEYIPDRDSKG